MSMNRFIVAAALALTACATMPTATTLATAQADVQAALTLYGIAKGIGQVAAASDPAVAPAVLTAISTLDPLAAKAQTALTDATADAAAVEALAVTIRAQAAALTVVAAPAVKVVAGGVAPG